MNDGMNKPRGQIDETVIDRLAEFWPEPREQLHFGGWDATNQIIERLGLEKVDSILDICCGEGSTACYLGKSYDKKVKGIDILESAIEVARNRAQTLGISDKVSFEVGDIFELPFSDSSFDVVYGQDPDGLAHKDRKLIFQEIKRVLKPHGIIGFQLWTPGTSASDKKVEYFENKTIESGFPEMVRLSVHNFVEDLKTAGFTNIIIEDLSNIYANHMKGMRDKFSKKGKKPDVWHQMLLDLMDDGVKFGVRIIAKALKNHSVETFSKDLPKADKLYYYGTGVFSPNFILDFDTVAEEKKYLKLILEYLSKKHPKFDWKTDIQGVLASGAVDNYSPPKVGSFLSVNITDVIESKEFNIRISDVKFLDCSIEDIFIDIYHFNCASLHFIVKFPEEAWQDKEVLQRVRFFVQKHTHPLEEFGIDMESIFGIVVSEINSIIEEVIKEINPPILKTPFLDFTRLSEEIQTELFWTHSTIVAIMPADYNVNSPDFHDILLNVNPKGIYNYSIVPKSFAYVESGDSLIILPNTADIRGRAPRIIANEDWITWIAIHHYKWKTVWELDRGFYLLLNVVTSHLKYKRTEQYRDVYAVNALINHIKLLLDTHKSRNITTTYYSIQFLEEISDAWRTGEILEAAESKMDILRELISQLDEIESARRSERVELFLTLLGVFALGSLVLDFLGAMSFGDLIPDGIKLIFGIGLPLIFSIVAYRLLKK
jgi:ubiquinone/menaquinone biosynthesis C-methylase UbiE